MATAIFKIAILIFSPTIYFNSDTAAMQEDKDTENIGKSEFARYDVLSQMCILPALISIISLKFP